MASEDLLSGKISAAEKAPADRVLQEASQLLSLRQSLFSSAIALCTVLYMAAIIIAIFLVYMLSHKSDVHWHASLLVAAFVIPPTVIILALMRGVFKSTVQEAESTGFPTADFCKDAFKEIFKKGLDTATKVDKAQ